MFSKTCKMARDFTAPVLIAQKRYSGDCFATIGAMVIINEDGWFVTANHIVDCVNTVYQSTLNYQKLVEERKAVEDDTKMFSHVKSKKLSNALKIQSDAVTNCTVFWSMYGDRKCNEFYTLPEVDLAIGRIENFDKRSISSYPKFKDPKKALEQGTALCKMGYPFFNVKPEFDGTTFSFPGAFPMPMFPIDGLFSREIFMGMRGKNRLLYLETTSPGLRGQSGGPTMDTEGAIWAIQSQTNCLRLNFGENAKTADKEHIQNQYLNVGIGIHTETIISFLDENGVSYQLSDY